MDDDDYYPPCRVSHAVDMLRTNPRAMCAGSSEVNIYFKHIQQMYQFGPYGPNHSTAATFAFRRELLKDCRFEDNAAVAEERYFLKDYTVPFVQLDPLKSILVFSHDHNSFDKKNLLDKPNQFMRVSDKTVDDFVKEADLKQFFMYDIDELLKNYEPGKPENKPDVLKQINDIQQQREDAIADHQKKQKEYQDTVNKITQMYGNQNYENKINEMSLIIQELTMENKLLNDKVKYYEEKIKQIIKDQIEKSKQNK
jgi:hypothetical protein